MSKAKTKYRWLDDEEEDVCFKETHKSKDKDRRSEKKLRDAIKGKDMNYFLRTDQ